MLVKQVNNYLYDWFGFPKEKTFCQIASVAHDMLKPHIRTMRLYDVNSEGELVFFTETNTTKWKDFVSNSHVGVCILNFDVGQMVVEGVAILKTQSSDADRVNFYWNNYLDQYWRNFYISKVSDFSSTSNQAPSSFGVIVVKPSFWEIIELNRDDFLKSSRKQYKLNKNKWVVNEKDPV